MILFRTCGKNRISYKGFKWNPPGQETIAPDWDPNPEIDCGNGLHGISNEKNMSMAYINLSNENVLQVVEVKEENCVLSNTKNKYRFRAGTVIEEVDCDEGIEKSYNVLMKYEAYNILSTIKIPSSYDMKDVFRHLEDEALYLAGCNWMSLSDELLREAFERLREEWLYRAGCDWRKSAITNDLLKKAFNRLEGKWLYWAGYNWRKSAITDDVLQEAFGRLEEKWKGKAERDWRIFKLKEV